MKRLAWLLIGMGTVGLLGHAAVAQADSGDATTTAARQQAAFLEESVAASGARVQSFLVHDYNVIDQKFLSPAALGHVGQTVAGALGLTKGTLVTRSERGENFYKLSGTDANGLKISVYCTSFQLPHDKGSTVLVVRASRAVDNLDGLGNAMATVATAVETAQVQPDVSAYVDAVLPGLASSSEANGLVDHVLQRVGATRVEGMRSSDETSESAYAPSEPKFIVTGHHRMNLQVAVHQDSAHRQTDVIVGTPIIVDPY